MIRRALSGSGRPDRGFADQPSSQAQILMPRCARGAAEPGIKQGQSSSGGQVHNDNAFEQSGAQRTIVLGKEAQLDAGHNWSEYVFVGKTHSSNELQNLQFNSTGLSKEIGGKLITLTLLLLVDARRAPLIN